MVYYCKADAAYVRISSDKLWKMEEVFIIVEYKNELYEYLLKSSMKKRILAEKQYLVADEYFIEWSVFKSYD